MKKIFLSLLVAVLLSTTFSPTIFAYGGDRKEAVRLIEKAEWYAGALKWEVSFEGSADGRTRPGEIYANTRQAWLDANKYIGTLSKGNRDQLYPRLEANVGVYVERAMRYNDAISAGVKLENARKALEAQLNRNVVDQALADAYNQLNYELKKEQALVSLVYGQSTRAKLRQMYEDPAVFAREDARFQVAVYNELQRLKGYVANDDEEAIAASNATIEEWLASVPNKTHQQSLAVDVAVVLGNEPPPITIPLDPKQQEEAIRLIEKAEWYAGALKWAVSFEGSADGRTRPGEIYANTRQAWLDAQAYIETLPTYHQEPFLQRLEDNVGVYVERAMRYNDAISAGVKLENARKALEAQLKRNVVDQAFANAYNQLNYELKKEQALVSLVYGQSTRVKLRQMYEDPAVFAREDARFQVAVYNELQRLKGYVASGDEEAITASNATIEEWLANVPNETHKSNLQRQWDRVTGNMSNYMQLSSITTSNGNKTFVMHDEPIHITPFEPFVTTGGVTRERLYPVERYDDNFSKFSTTNKVKGTLIIKLSPPDDERYNLTWNDRLSFRHRQTDPDAYTWGAHWLSGGNQETSPFIDEQHDQFYVDQQGSYALSVTYVDQPLDAYYALTAGADSAIKKEYFFIENVNLATMTRPQRIAFLEQYPLPKEKIINPAIKFTDYQHVTVNNTMFDDETWHLYFTENIDRTTVNENNVLLFNEAGNRVFLTFFNNGIKPNSLIINTRYNLVAGKNYYIVITDGVQSIDGTPMYPTVLRFIPQ